jgi:hypothetical protein
VSGQGGGHEAGPVPVRDLLSQPEERGAGGAGPETGPGAGPGGRTFEAGGEAWVARVAGAGCYGTGRRGVARLVAVHFFRAASPDEPDREALVPAAAVGVLRAAEWVEVWSRATPIEQAD